MQKDETNEERKKRERKRRKSVYFVCGLRGGEMDSKEEISRASELMFDEMHLHISHKKRVHPLTLSSCRASSRLASGNPTFSASERAWQHSLK